MKRASPNTPVYTPSRPAIWQRNVTLVAILASVSESSVRPQTEDTFVSTL